jgi:hypothetical protein
MDDPVTANRGKSYLFKDDIVTPLQSTSSAALVCSAFGGWGSPEPLTTPRFPRLSVEVWVDPLRDSALNISESPGGTRTRGQAVFTAVNRRLNRTDPVTVLWGDLVTTGCQLLTEPQFVPVVGGDGDGLLHGQAFYGVSVFGVTDALS